MVSPFDRPRLKDRVCHRGGRIILMDIGEIRIRTSAGRRIPFSHSSTALGSSLKILDSCRSRRMANTYILAESLYAINLPGQVAGRACHAE
jgi:hypothetical protein